MTPILRRLDALERRLLEVENGLKAPAQKSDLAIIQEVVAAHYNIAPADMLIKRRPSRLATPRQVAMALCHWETCSCIADIGHAFGRAHSTVVHASKTVANRCETDGRYAAEVEACRAKVKEALSRKAA